MENYLTQITNYLLTQSWQIAVLILVIAAVNLALKNKSAHVRYLLWLIVLAKCLVPPLFTVPVAVLPEESPAVVVTVLDRSVAEPLARPVTPVAVAPVPTVVERPARFNNRQWLGFGWVVGVAAFVLFAVIKALQTNSWLRRQRKLLPAELQSGIEDLFSGLDFRTLPKVWLVEGIGQPFVWGLLRGSIYLPADFVKANSTEHRRGVLGHELGHIRRLDAAVNILQIIAQAVFWFHPFVWWANRKIRAEREKCCDEMAIARLGAKVRDYSIAIVNTLVVEHESTRPVPSLAVAGPVKNIEERIKTMLRPGKKFYKHPSLIAATVVLLLAVLTVPTALVLTARAETKTVAERGEKPTKSMFEAATDGDIHQIRLHLLIGTAVNAKGKRGRTALHHTVSKGHTEIARLLIAQGADVTAKDETEKTPLHSAAAHGKTETANLLLLKGADVNAKDKYGLTPVSRALLSAGGGRRMVELLVSRGAKVSALHLAAHRGNLDKIRNSLKEGTNVDARDEAGHTPLYYAASAGHMHVVEFLISKGTDVHARDKRGETPLYYAADAGWRNVAELLIAKGADVNARGYGGTTALESAAWLGRGDVATLLIAKGADVMAKSDYEYVPLHAAASCGLVEVAELLIDKGSNINARAKCDETPLTQAADSGQVDLAKLLIDRGADVNAECIFGCTPLRHAVKWGHEDVVGLLIAKGADVNIKDDNDRTPLNWAAMRRHKDVVELLIAKGADLNARDKWGRTPLDVAVAQGYTEVVELLRKHGAEE